MMYCPKCKKIYDQEKGICASCKKNLRTIEDKNTPVAVCSASGVDRARIAAALSDAGIPSSEVRIKSISAEAITGGDVSDVNILVPYQAYEKAFEICVGIGAADSEESPSDKLIEDIESKKTKFDKDAEEFGEMSPGKRTAVRIISAILLIVIFSGIIWGFDYLLGILKDLF